MTLAAYPEGTDWHREIDALQAEAYGPLSATLAGLGYIWSVGLAVAMSPGFIWGPLLLPVWLGSLGLLLLLVRRPRALREGILLVGSVVTVALSLFSEHSAYSPPTLLLLLVIVSLVTLFQSYRVVVAFTVVVTILVGLAYRSDPSVLGADGPYSGVAAVWALAGIGWLASSKLRTALDWALHGYESNRLLSSRLQTERGLRNATLKALREANALLKRTTYDLAEAREEAERARQMKAQFAANISHELRTPLHLIVGFSQMMYASPESYQGVRWTPDLRADVQELHDSAVHLLGLIDDVLDLSQIEAARLPISKERIAVGPLVREAVETARHLLRGRCLDLTVVAPPELPSLDADPTRVRQVLLNLLNNAARFTTTGGITVRVAPRDDVVEFTVEDTGVGIPPDQLISIFEEFHQVDGSLRREHGGTGLGLAICKQFVSLHGGRIWAESEVGQGSIFHFTLPLPSRTVVPLQRSRTPAGWRYPAAKPKGSRLLVTTAASEEFAHYLRRYLTDVEVIPAADLTQAAQVAGTRQADAIVLPAGEGSDEAAYRLAEVTAGMALPIFTCALPLERHLALAEGFTHCLMKPFTAKQLLSVVREAAPKARTVLVVDDSPGVVRLIKRALDTAGDFGQVLSAGDGLTAIQLLSARPDAILLDLLLPMASGLQVLEAVRAIGNGYRPSVIAITAYGFEQELSTMGQGFLAVRRGRSLSAAEMARCIEANLEALPARHVSLEVVSAPQ